MSDNKEICVNILPSEIIQFTKWKLTYNDTNTDSVWFDSGQSVNIKKDSYTIIGKTINGWTIEDNNINVDISDSDDIIVYAYVGFKQPNMKFGKNNTNLVGSAVEEGKYRIVKSKTKLKCPL